MIAKAKKYFEFHSFMNVNPDFHKKKLDEKLLDIVLKISEYTSYFRVGVWLFSPDKEVLNQELLVQNGVKLSKISIYKNDFPFLFSQIGQERLLISSKTTNPFLIQDEHLKYFSKHKIGSLVLCPIFSDGETIGCFNLEYHDEDISLDFADQIFLTTCADMIGRLFETQKRQIYEHELKERINYLEFNLRRRIDELNQAKLSLDIALQSAKAAKWEWDVETNQCFYNDTWFENLGYRPNELPSVLSTFKSLIHPSDTERVFNELIKYINGETSIYECRFRLIAKNGDVKWFLDRGCVTQRHFDGTPSRLTGIIIDITPFVKLEETKRLSEQQLKSMIASIPTPVVMIDKDLNVLSFSSKWAEDWGGGTIQEFSQNGWIHKISSALDGNSISSEEDYVEFSNGSYKWLKWVIKPWRNYQNEISGVILMIENITEKKIAEIKISQSSKLSALGEMAGGIAHEINNPLSIIKGYVDLLKKYTDRQALNLETMKQYLSKIDITIERISRIVGGMRRFARESSSDKKINYPLSQIISETLDICHEKLNNNGVKVEVEVATSNPLINCRPVEISQVLLNLINNSFQAIEKQLGAFIKIYISENDHSYLIQVSDSGPGIRPEVRSKIFQPFFTTKEVGVGTGLGLSISRGIIEDHDGKLYYKENAPYTTFVIDLPKVDQDQALKSSGEYLL